MTDPEGRPERIEPSSAPCWPDRVERVLGLLRELGPTATEPLIFELWSRYGWTADRARNALAAAHPLAVERRGTWHLGELAPARECPKVLVQEIFRPAARGSPSPQSELGRAEMLGISRRLLRYRRDREQGPQGTYRCGLCRQRGHTRRTCPRRAEGTSVSSGAGWRRRAALDRPEPP